PDHPPQRPCRSLLTPPPPRTTLFPYTTLFRSAKAKWPGSAWRRPPRALIWSRIAQTIHRTTPPPTAASGASVVVPSRNANAPTTDRKSTRLNSSHSQISYAVFCLKKKKKEDTP